MRPFERGPLGAARPGRVHRAGLWVCGLPMNRRRGRSPEPPLIDPADYPKSEVGLRVAAEFLGLNERTVRARIDSGQLSGWRDGKVYRIDVKALGEYRERRLAQ